MQYLVRFMCVQQYISADICAVSYSNLIYVRMSAAIVFLSGTLLLYTAVVAPAQIFIWDNEEAECQTFPTLYFDVFVDSFFIVSLFLHSPFCSNKMGAHFVRF